MTTSFDDGRILRSWGLALALVWCAAPAQAKYIGEDPYCGCSECGQPSNLATAEGSISLSEGNLQEAYRVGHAGGGAGGLAGLELRYNSYGADGSRDMSDTGLGYGWTHTYNVFLFRQQSSMFRYDGAGRVTKYQPTGATTYSSAVGHTETLVKNPDGSFTLTQKDQTRYRFSSISGTPFLVGGSVWRLVSKTDRNNDTTTVTYTAGLLTKVTDPYGRSLDLAYNGAKKLVSVRDPLGRVTTFAYDSSGRRLNRITDPAGRSVVYTYNTLNQITGKTDKDGRVFTYQYQNLKPVGVRDGASQSYFGLSNPNNWAYDSTALAYQMRRVYLATTTTLTDGRGNVWRYDYDANGYIVRSTAPDGAMTQYAYDPGTARVSSRTDANGQTTQYEYDAQGNRTKVTDALGHVTTYTYEPSFNQVATVTDPSGRVTQYQYDATGNRILERQAVGDPAQRTRTWTYDARGNVLSETDWRGFVTQYTYDANGHRATMTEAVGQPEQRTTTTVYDTAGNLTARTDPGGHTTQYVYDSLDRLVRTVDPAGQQTLYGYDSRGNRTQTTDRLGQVTTYQYDARSRLIKTIDPLGQNETQTYDANQNRTSVTDKNGHATTATYDVQNRLTTLTDALGNVTRSEYDPVGNLVRRIDARGNATRYTYDAVNRRIATLAADGGITTYEYATTAAPCCTPTLGSDHVSKQTDGDGKVTCYKYDALDRLVKEVRKQTDTDCDVEDADDAVTRTTYDSADNRLAVQEPNGNTTSYQYDALNRQIKETNSAGDATDYAYDADGNRVQTTAPNGNVTIYAYDALERRTSQQDSVGPVHSYTYDAEGNRITETDGNGLTTSYGYDGLDRLIQRTDAMGETTRYEYDAVGNLTKVTDREGVITRHSYDLINRRIATTEAQGTPVERTTTYQYDPVGNLIRFTDANGHATQYAYDAVNRRVSETYPDPAPNTRTYSYDFVGNVTSRTDQRGQTTTYHYSDLHFLVTRDYPVGPDDTFTYDLSGRRLTATRGGWVVTYAYDGANRVVATVQDSATVSYAYNIPGRTRTVTYPGGRVLVEATDLRSRLSDVDGTLVQYTYDLGDRVLTRTHRNGVVTTYTYDANNRMTSVDHTFTAGPTLLAGYAYAYDREGNRRYEQHLVPPLSARSEAYQYDALYRLVDYRVGLLVGSTVPLPVTQTAYALDPLGNWNTKTTDAIPEVRLHNQANETVQVDANALTFDDNGNLSNDGALAYDYDEENRLIRATRLADSRVVGQYQYDALGRRVAKIEDPALVSAPVTTRYYYDEARVIEEQDAGGTTLATYTYGHGQDDLLTMDRGGATHHYHQNALGSVAALTDIAGNVVERYAYDAYGAPEITDGAFVAVLPTPWGTPQSAVGNPHLFTGHRLDSETGLYHYGARYYDTHLGRYLSRHPLGYADALNLYEYAQGNPVNAVDRGGRVVAPNRFASPRMDLFAPEEVKATSNVAIGATLNSIKCSGGRLVVQNTNLGPERACTQEHEESHMADWRARYGAELCKGVPDDHLPVGGEGYAAFLKKSECDAYRIGKACRERLLAACKNEDDKKKIQAAIDRDNAQIAHYCE